MRESQIVGSIPRRQFSKQLAATGLGLAARPLRAKTVFGRNKEIPLGFDNYSIRELGWKAPRLIEYAASRSLDFCLFSDLYVFESHKRSDLKEIKHQADDAGIKIHVGTSSICPTSIRFNSDFGTAEEHLIRTINIAQVLGSTVARCFLGTWEDRLSQGGIEHHMKNTVRVFRNVASQARDAGVRIAIENHAGDMQAREVVRLIEEAGSDFVGVTVDSGNATWSLENPLQNLEILGPYAVSSGIRDSMVWEVPNGFRVQWTAMGEGCVNQVAYMERFAQLCPGVPVQLEIISGVQREFPCMRQDFWRPYPWALARDFAFFASLAKQGKALNPFDVAKENNPTKATATYQRDELERSIRYCREVLGLGLK